MKGTYQKMRNVLRNDNFIVFHLDIQIVNCIMWRSNWISTPIIMNGMPEQQ